MTAPPRGGSGLRSGALYGFDSFAAPVDVPPLVPGAVFFFAGTRSARRRGPRRTEQRQASRWACPRCYRAAVSKRDPKRRPARKVSRPAVPPRRLPPPAPLRFGTLVRVTHAETGEPALLEPLSPHFYPTPRVRAALCERLRLAFERLRERGHPAFPPYQDTIVTGDGVVALVMRDLEGETLRAALARHAGPLPRRRAYDVALALLDALDALHGLGMMHRLVSPSALFLPAEGGPILLDAGVADALLDGLQGPTMAGTYTTFSSNDYHAPEETTRLVRDPRADLFSAGVVLYEMLSGQRPPPARPSLRVGGLERGTGGPRLGLAAPALAGSRLESVVARAMSPAPDDRFPTARAFLDALADAEPEVVAP